MLRNDTLWNEDIIAVLNVWKQIRGNNSMGEKILERPLEDWNSRHLNSR